MKSLVCLLSFAVCSFAAAPLEIDALITAARGLPAEFSADSLLRLAASGGVDASRKAELIRQAFDKGAQAQQPYKRHPIPGLGQASLPFLNKANQQDLDALSLQLRAVDQLLAIDPAGARALFLRIAPPQLPPLHCADVMVFDVDHFYQTLGAVTDRSFTAPEKAAGDPARFLARYAAAITSPVQVGPMADAIAGVEGPDADFKTVVSAYATALGKIHGDDRSFTYAQKAGNSIEKLTAQCKRRNVSPLLLLESFRLYLVVNLSSSRCADADKMSGGGTSFGMITGTDVGAPISSMVTFFNDKLRMDPLQAIQEIESTPSRLEGEAMLAPSCQDAACKAIVERYRELIASRGSAEWQSKLETVVNELKRWSPPKASSPDFFRDKAAIFSDLLNLAPPGAARDGVLRGLMDFLVQGREQATSRMEWFLPLNALLARTVLDPAGFGPFAAEMRKSSDAVVSVYARLEALAPRPADRLMGLL